MAARIKCDNKNEYLKACKQLVEKLGYTANPGNYGQATRCTCTSGDAELPAVIVSIRKQAGG